MIKRKVLNKKYLKRCKICERFVLKTHLNSGGWCEKCVMESKREITNEKKKREVYGVISTLSYDFMNYNDGTTTVSNPYIQDLWDHIETEQKKIRKNKRRK